MSVSVCRVPEGYTLRSLGFCPLAQEAVPPEPPTPSMSSDQVLQIIKLLRPNRHQCLLQRSAFKMSIKQLLKKELNIFICVFEDSFIGTMSEREQSEEMGIF